MYWYLDELFFFLTKAIDFKLTSANYQLFIAKLILSSFFSRSTENANFHSTTDSSSI